MRLVDLQHKRVGPLGTLPPHQWCSPPKTCPTTSASTNNVYPSVGDVGTANKLSFKNVCDTIFCPNKNMFSPGPREYLTNHVCSASGRLVEEGLKNSTFHHSGALEKFSVILCVLIWFCIFFGNFLCLHGDNIWGNLEVECFFGFILKAGENIVTVFCEMLIYGIGAAGANCINYEIKFCPSSMAA